MGIQLDEEKRAATDAGTNGADTPASSSESPAPDADAAPPPA